MMDIYVELAGKKAVAWSLEWPGWCRVRANEAAAMLALSEAVPRYQRIAQRANREFAPGDLTVVERLEGDGSTAWGIPSVMAPIETQPIDASTAEQRVALLEVAWDMLDEVVASSPNALRKGPRGGGRDRDEVWRHVVEAEREYARRIGVRQSPFDIHDRAAIEAMRQGIVEVLCKASNGEPLAAKGWNTSYAVRRIAWHVVDHIWEIEDRRS